MSESDTPTNTCQASCQAPTGDGVFLCVAHTDELTRSLRAVPSLVDDLEVTVTRQSRTGGQKHGSRSATTPLPWNDHASICRTELNAIINAWAYETAQIWQDTERDSLDGIHASDTAELARWLGRNTRTARRHDQAGDLYAEILDALTQATRAVDLPPEKKFIGVCKHHPADWLKPCREDLYALPHQRWVTCRMCTHAHDADERRTELLDGVEGQAATTGVLAGLMTGLGVPIGSSTIRKYAAEGRLKVISRDRNRRPQYLVGDVLDVFLRREKNDGISQRSA